MDIYILADNGQNAIIIARGGLPHTIRHPAHNPQTRQPNPAGNIDGGEAVTRIRSIRPPTSTGMPSSG
jgi:hypothetical protein